MAVKTRKPHVPDLRRFFARFSEIAQRVLEREVEELAERERAAFVKRIEEQDFASFDATPLNSAYLERKIAAGGDPRIMIASGFYKDNIKVFRRANQDGTITYYIGFHKRMQARDLAGDRVPVLLVKIAWVHEKGSAKMKVPARPHWEPHYADMRKRAKAERERIRAAIMKEMKRRYPRFA